MLRVNVKHSPELKHKLSTTLRNWLPVLHASLSDLGETMEPFVEGNPLVEIETGFEEQFEKKIPKPIFNEQFSNSRTEQIEALTFAEKSLWDVLDEQIQDRLFPTPISQNVARHVVDNLDASGYYEGETEKFCQEEGISVEEFEKYRNRFRYLEPSGIGARDLCESFIFQLEASSISDEHYDLAVKMIHDLEGIHNYSKEKGFADAMHAINSFKNPPAIDYMEDSSEIVPDLLIFFDEEEGVEVKVNDQYYPTVKIDHDYAVQDSYISKKFKEAKNLVDALEMRKATLYKVGLMIVEYQYDFFTGGSIKPLTLKTLADEFGHNPSTISRAIANKYIACDRGIFTMKEFFTTAIDEDTSNAAIKEYLSELVKNEPRDKPLSDMKLLQMIQEKFGITMVRRTIAKYRKQLNIAGSSERKKLYQLDV